MVQPGASMCLNTGTHTRQAEASRNGNGCGRPGSPGDRGANQWFERPEFMNEASEDSRSASAAGWCYHKGCGNDSCDKKLSDSIGLFPVLHMVRMVKYRDRWG